jgi:hypothetical protein
MFASGVKRTKDREQNLVLPALRKDLETRLPRVQQVIRQAKARVLGGNVHVAGKLVSVFEPSTEVIRKGKASKPTEFGKMVKVQEAENQIITHYEVFEKRPMTRTYWCQQYRSMKSNSAVYHNSWPVTQGSTLRATRLSCKRWA